MTETYTGRCMRCKENDREIKNPEIVTNARGTRAVKGNCAVCDCGMYKFLKKEA